MRKFKNLFVVTLVIFLSIGSTNYFAQNKFTNGDKVKANSNLHVRSTPGGTDLGTQALGAQGTVTNGPVYASYGGQYFYWYQVSWPTSPTSGWSAQDYLDKVSTTLTAPTLISPADGTTILSTSTTEFTWNGVANATGYEIQFDSETPKDRGTSLSFSLVSPAVGAHTWKVRARNAAGTGPWSTQRSFTVTSAAAPTISSITPNPITADPSNNYQTLTINGTNFVNKPSIILTWTGQTGYTLPSSQITYVSSTQLTISIKLGASADNWTVKVVNPNGQSSNTYSFSAISVPSAPTLISPADGTTILSTSTTEFTWNGVANATGYEIQFDSETPKDRGTSLSFSLVSPAVGAHTWKVRARNAAGTGPWSTQRSFTVTSAAAPTISSITPNPITADPSNNYQTLTINGTNFVNKPSIILTWTGQTGYTLPSSQITYVSSTQLTISIKLGASADNWTVKVVNPNGQSSNTYSFSAISVPSAPTLISPADGTTILSTSTTEFTWNGVANATGYEIQFDSETPKDRGTSLSFSLVSPAVGAHTWKVRARNAAGTGPWSTQWSFTVTSAAAPTISSVSPNPVTGSTSSQAFTINGSNFVSGCNVTLRVSSSVYPNRTISSFSSTQIVINPIFTTDLATWTVQIINPDGKSSNVYSFNVFSPTLSAPTLIAPANGTTILSTSTTEFTWNGVANATGYEIQFDSETPKDRGTSLSFSLISPSIGNHIWKVRAKNTAGSGSWSIERSFRVTGPAPSISSVSPNPVTGSSSAQSFTINGTNFVSGCNVTLKEGSNVYANRTLSSFSSTQIVINPVFSTAAATWSVQVINPDGLASNVLNFNVISPTLSAPTLIAPANGTTILSTSTTEFTWNGVANATGYEIQFDSETPKDRGTSLSFSLISSSVGNHVWKVRAKNTAGSGSWSIERSFTVTGPAPKINISSPNSLSKWLAGTSEDISWASSAEIKFVNIKLSSDGGLSFGYSLAQNVTNTGSQKITLPNISSNKCQIKIENANDINTIGVSGNFEIISSNISTNKATVISETNPSSSVLSKNYTFTKTWIIKNVGTTTWGIGTSLNYISGTLSISHTKMLLPKSIAPGESISIDMLMKTPNIEGSYSESWQLLNEKNEIVYFSDGNYLNCLIKVSENASNKLLVIIEEGKSLINVEPGKTIQNYIVYVKDGKLNPIPYAEIKVVDATKENNWETISKTDQDGKYIYITSPIKDDMQDGSRFIILFSASKSGYISSDLIQSILIFNNKPKSPSPFISLGQKEINFNANVGAAKPNEVIVKMKNNSGGNLNYLVNGIPSWLDIDPIVGISNDVDIHIQPNTTNLTSENSPYKAVLTIESTNASNSPVNILVSYSIASGSASQLTYGKLKINASKILQSNPGQFTLSGNININNILNFAGYLVVDETNKNNPRLKGSGEFYLDNVYKLGKVKIYSGDFDIGLVGDNSLLQLSTNKILDQLNIAGFKAHVDNVYIIESGVRISGTINFDNGFIAKVNVDNLEITKNGGIKFSGGLHIQNVQLSNYIQLQNLDLELDQNKNTFKGSANVITPALTIGGQIGFINGKLDDVQFAASGFSIPIVGTGFNLNGVSGGVSNLYIPENANFSINCDISTTVPTIFQFNQVGLQYQLPFRLNGHGTLRMFNSYNIANIGFEVSSEKLSFSGSLKFGDFVNGDAELSYGYKENMLKGKVFAEVQIPDGQGILFDFLRTIKFSLPHSFLKSETYLEDYKVFGEIKTFIKDFSYFIDFKPVLSGSLPDFNLGSGGRNINYLILGIPGIAEMNIMKSQNNIDGFTREISQKSLNKNLSIHSANNFTQEIPIISDMKTLMIQIKYDFNLPTMILKDPSGKQYLTSGESLVKSNVQFLNNENIKTSFWVIDKPILGNWKLEVTGTDKIMFDAIAFERERSIKINKPVQRNELNQIDWWDSGQNGKDFIEIYYDKNNYGLDGVLIQNNIPAKNGNGSITWNNSEINPGEYFIYAILRNDERILDYCYSSGTIKVKSSLLPPYNINTSITDSSLVLTWQKPYDSSITGYLLEYWDSQKSTTIYSVSLADTNNIELKNLRFGHNYRFSIKSLSSSGYSSEPIVTNDIPYISRRGNNNPTIYSFEENQLLGATWENKNLIIRGFDYDGDQLHYLILKAPSTMQLNYSTGELNWIPSSDEVGNNNCTIAVLDSKGGIDTLNFIITIKDPQKVQVKLDRLYYAPEAQIAQIKIFDQAQASSIITNGEVTAEIRTNNKSLLIKATQNSGNSSYFNSNIDLSQLGLNETDTIKVNYHTVNGETLSDYAIWTNKIPIINIDTWIKNSSGTSDWLSSVDFIDQNIGWAVGQTGDIINGGSIILKTTNGGTSWISQSSGISRWLFSVDFIDQNTGWAVGQSGTILKTTNGGNTWIGQSSGITDWLRSVHFFNQNIGWVVGDGSTILKTTNGGINWFRQSSGISDWLTSVDFVDENIGWIVGQSGVILKTINGGTNWTSQISGTSGNLQSVDFIDQNTGWTVGVFLNSSGVILGPILKTTNGGANWINQTNGNNKFLYSVNFIDQNTGWAVGSLGTILKTTNGGTNWISQTSGTQAALNSVCFVNNTGWVVGETGTILKTTNGSVTSVKDDGKEIPNQFVLFQNYPNPFNPNTMIKFYIPQLSKVTLKIYDILGREVEKLVDEEKSPGKYEVQFNVRGLASGIYFYRLQAGEFSRTKKLMLIK